MEKFSVYKDLGKQAHYLMAGGPVKISPTILENSLEEARKINRIVQILKIQ